MDEPSAISRAPEAHREAWIDNLRVALIVGVIGSHVSVIYALDVGWWYEERTASALATAVLAGMFAPGLLFGMGLLFFVAGTFTPPAFGRKGPRRFLVDRAWRLGLPTVAYLFGVNPALNFFGSRAMGEVESVTGYLRRTYRDDVELGVAWFMAALLLFSVIYAVWRGWRPPAGGAARRLRVRDMVIAGLFIAAASFLVRLRFPVLSGEEWLTLNLWEYPQMAAMFVLGVLARERGWFDEGLSPQVRRTCAWAAVIGLALAIGVGVGVALTDDPARFLGGWVPEATLIPVVEATLALGMSLWAVDWFRRRLNRSGPLVRGLGRASFLAYLLHVPITVLLAIGLRDVDVPAELKFLVVFGLGATASFGIGWLLARGRGPGRIL